MIDQTIIITTPSDPRLATYSPAPCRCEQADGEPLFLVVGLSASDDALQRMADRFGVDLGELRRVRARKEAALGERTDAR